jgi:hypothetical protein
MPFAMATAAACGTSALLWPPPPATVWIFAALERNALYSACRDRYFNADGGPLRDCMRRIAAPA